KRIVGDSGRYHVIRWNLGPGSAGANPGPACYGLGGGLPTVTDANLLLGALHAENALGGRIRLDRERAEAALRQHVAQPLGLDVLQAAAGIVKIVTTNMAIDLRLAFQQRGEDPRQFVLAAFGGAGPLQAARLARDLKIATVLVPLYPGLASAIGLVQTTVKHVYVQSSSGLLSNYPVAQFNHHFAELTERAMADVREEGFDADREVQIRRQVDMRYPHQGYQLAVPCPDSPLREADKPALKREFDALHQRIYGANAAEEDAELVTFRVIVEITVPRLELPEIAVGDGNPSPARQGTRPLYNLDTERFDEAAIYQRTQLRAGDRFDGPAIIEQFDTTTVVLTGQRAEVDRYGNLLIDTGAAL
uniref:hydantoinase/oxoprolinase family protein n=1 Tax=Candidatus Entotheonella palauensis TaxID=93172 RepID=UPI0011779E33